MLWQMDYATWKHRFQTIITIINKFYENKENNHKALT